MLLLALDTSTRYSSIALCSDSEFLGECTWYSGNNHSVELFEYTQRLCAQAQVSLQQVDLIAVAIGPGSFNGVRVALATAKTLAFALRKPLVGVSTLDILAFQQAAYGVQRPVCALIEAGRSEVYAANYMFDELHSAYGELSYRMKRLGDYLLVTPQQLVAYLQEHAPGWLTSAVDPGPTFAVGTGLAPVREIGSVPTAPVFQFPTVLFCGEISQQTQQALHSSLPQQSLFIRGARATRRAVSLAAIALQRVQAGHTDDPLALEPLYLRRPSITKSARKQPLFGDTTLSAGQAQGTVPMALVDTGQAQSTVPTALVDTGQAQGTAPTAPVDAGQVQGTVPTAPVREGEYTIEREDSALRH